MMNRTRPRVLVVEDDPTLNLALSRLFETWGFVTVSAHTVAEAVDRLALQLDLVVLDLILPDGDGSEVLGAVRTRGLACPVVVSTGIPLDSPKLDALRRLKPDQLLLKPMSLAPLEAIAQDIRDRFVPRRAASDPADRPE